MNWKIVYKDKSKQPTEGVYTDWKEQIAEECYHRCVYCSIHEAPWGGIDHYHIDHFRPKSLAQFSQLENDICNLFYACPVCNRFKSDDWPGDLTHLDQVAYPDPSKIDYSNLLKINKSNFLVSSDYVSGNYVVNRLYLNRKQLILERREQILNEQYDKIIKKIIALSKKSINLKPNVIRLFAEIQLHKQKRNQIRPYKLSDIKKPNTYENAKVSY